MIFFRHTKLQQQGMLSKKKEAAGHANQAVCGLELPKFANVFFFPMFFLVTAPYIESK